MDLQLAFPNFDQSLLDNLTKVGEVAYFPADKVLIQPGSYVKGTILILDGIVKLYLEGEKGESVFLYYLKRGDACALSMICTSDQSIDIKAKAITNVKAMIISAEHMDEMIRNYPGWHAFLLETCQLRLRELLGTLNQVAFHPLDQKLVFYLRRQFEALKSKTISITHQEIAFDLNSSREVISRLLKKMESEKLITLHRNEITNIALDVL